MWITVDDTSSWPTADGFTIRYTPVADDGSTPPPPPPAEEEAICNDGFDNDGDGMIDCADSDCADISFCGAEGRTTTCSDGYDNDGDGDIDCADSGCSKNKACR